MEEEIKRCVELLEAGKVILYPTDTVWGIGCDATNGEAIQKIYRIKQRHELKSMLILLDKSDKLPIYVKRIPLIAWDLLENTHCPTTYIYPTAQNLPSLLIPSDGTVAIRIVNHSFCRKLIAALGKPIISTSANISGELAPDSFANISENIKSQMDHIVPQTYIESIPTQPSRIIKYIDDYNFAIIRK